MYGKPPNDVLKKIRKLEKAYVAVFGLEGNFSLNEYTDQNRVQSHGSDLSRQSIKATGEISLSSFGHSTYKNDRGKEYPMYLLDFKATMTFIFKTKKHPAKE